MAKELRSFLPAYFCRLEKVADTHGELLRTAERPLQALRNQVEQYRLVTRLCDFIVMFFDSKDVGNAELLKIEGLHERLVFKILMGIESEMSIIVDIITRFNQANQDLKRKLTHLENVRSQIDLTDPTVKELVNGTSHIPKLTLLMEWAVDGYRYFREAYDKFEKYLACVDYENEESIDSFIEAFNVDKFQTARINRILTFTYFLRNEKSQ